MPDRSTRRLPHSPSRSSCRQGFPFTPSVFVPEGPFTLSRSRERAFHPTSVGLDLFPPTGFRHGWDRSGPNHIESFVRTAALRMCPGCPEVSFPDSARKPARQGSEGAARARRKRHASAVSWRAKARGGASIPSSFPDCASNTALNTRIQAGNEGYIGGAHRRRSSRRHASRRGI